MLSWGLAQVTKFGACDPFFTFHHVIVNELIRGCTGISCHISTAGMFRSIFCSLIYNLIYLPHKHTCSCIHLLQGGLWNHLSIFHNILWFKKPLDEWRDFIPQFCIYELYLRHHTYQSKAIHIWCTCMFLFRFHYNFCFITYICNIQSAYYHVCCVLIFSNCFTSATLFS